MTNNKNIIFGKADLWDAKNWRPIWPKKSFLRRKIFFEIFYQIGLQFSAPHWSAFNSTGFILAWFYRKMFRGHIGSLFEKIRWGEDLHLNRNRRKTSTRGRLGTARTLLWGNQWFKIFSVWKIKKSWCSDVKTG